MSATVLLLTCEHASNAVPERYRELFRGADALLAGHQGWDLGALPVAQRLAKVLGREAETTLLAGEWTRLLVDLNRSPDNPRRFSRLTRTLPANERAELDARYHGPWRTQGVDWVRGRIEAGARVLHVCVHSFTPVWRGRVRRTEVGVLHVSHRALEGSAARRWQRDLRRVLPSIAVHRNLPYRGDTDGYVPWMAGRFPERAYCGLELELNQRLLADPARTVLVADAAAATLAQLLAELDRGGLGMDADPGVSLGAVPGARQGASPQANGPSLESVAGDAG